MTGGTYIMHTPSHTNVCQFFNFQLTFSTLILHLKCRNFSRVIKVKVFFLVLVYVFNFDLVEFSAPSLENGSIGFLVGLFTEWLTMKIPAINESNLPFCN